MFDYYMTVSMIVWFTFVIIYDIIEFKKLDYEFLIYYIISVLVCIIVDTLTTGTWELIKEIKYLKSLKDK